MTYLWCFFSADAEQKFILTHRARYIQYWIFSCIFKTKQYYLFTSLISFDINKKWFFNWSECFEWDALNGEHEHLMNCNSMNVGYIIKIAKRRRGVKEEKWKEKLSVQLSDACVVYWQCVTLCISSDASRNAHQIHSKLFQRKYFPCHML